MTNLWHPPQVLLTRLLLPLGFPLLTLGFTNSPSAEFSRVARHLMFFGACGVAMGISVEQAGAKERDRVADEQRANERRLMSSQLKLLTASGGISDENTLAAVSQLIEDLENSLYI